MADDHCFKTGALGDYWNTVRDYARNTARQGRDVLEDAGVVDPRRSLVSRAAPYAAGLGTAAGLYALLRKQRLSENPLLREIQKKSKGMLTVVEGRGDPSNYHWSSAPEWLQKLLIRLGRGADDVALHHMPLSEETHVEDLMKRLRTNQPLPPDLKVQKHQGAVFNMNRPGLDLLHRGDINIGGDTRAQVMMDYDKLHEAKLFAQYAPEAYPTTHGSLADVLQTHGAAPPRDINELVAFMRQKHPQGFVIKDRFDAAAGQPFMDVHRLHPQMDRRQHELLQQAVKDPQSVIVQDRLPIQREYRVHTLNGEVVPGAVFPRHKGIETAPRLRARDIKEMRPQVRAHLAKLPPAYRQNAVMGLDLARTPEGQWKIIETNMGGESGFLSPETYGFATSSPHHLYQAITGRASKPMAAVKGLAAGAGATLGVAGGQAAYRQATE